CAIYTFNYRNSLDVW
nr:immunoglobulin heavy chain junction region [Macaca mulatta]MOY28904.1 immunoglobulin heavy chain junction region [Macaca mulatta]